MPFLELHHPARILVLATYGGDGDVLPAVEAGATQWGWRYVGTTGRVFGIDTFGASGKGPEVLTHFGFTADNMQQEIRKLLEG